MTTVTDPRREKRMMPADWASLPSIAPSHIKLARGNRLGGNDRIDLEQLVGSSSMPLIKAAVSLLQPGEAPIFSIALGCTEVYGFNRNFDGFKAAACRARHDTFVKYGRWFRDHDNKPTSLHYGRHVLSAFNEKMGRVEVVTGLYQTKEAAERNGPTGRVADIELDGIESDSPPHVSMACKIPYDVCVSCQHKAAAPKDYCTEKTCKHGGCKNNLGRLYDDGMLLAVDNPLPDWFDLSNITNKKQADRIAVSYGAIKKAASSVEVPERFKTAFYAMLQSEQQALLQSYEITPIERLGIKSAGVVSKDLRHVSPCSTGCGFGSALFATTNSTYADEMFKSASDWLRRPPTVVDNVGVPLQTTPLKKAIFSVLLSDVHEKVARSFSGPPPASYAGYLLACVVSADDQEHAAEVITRINSCNNM